MLLIFHPLRTFSQSYKGEFPMELRFPIGVSIPILEEYEPDDPLDPKPAEDDQGSEDDDDELKKTEAGECPNCIKNSQPLGHGEEMMELSSAALVKAAYAGYSESHDVSELITNARVHIRNNPRRYISRRKFKGKVKNITYCYRSIKEALREAGMVPVFFQGSGVASNGVKDLLSVGFTNLLDNENVKEILQNNPKMAPKGAILVYETVPGAKASSAGHIEIKTEDSGTDGYISISETQRPTYGYPIPAVRKLIGVMIKT